MSRRPDAKVFLGLAAGALVLGGVLLYFQYSSLSARQGEVDDLKAEVAKAETLGRDLEESNRRLGDLKVQLAHLERGVQDYQYVPTLLKELEQVGNANGIQVLGVRPVIAPISAQPNEKEIRKAYDELTIEVRGRGTYGSVMRFLEGLQRFPKVVAARTLTLTPKTEGNEPTSASPKLDVEVELKVFVFPEAKVEAKPEDGSVASAEVSNNG